MTRTEAEIAADVVAWLRARGWTVYEEVEYVRVGRADIVAVRGPLLHVIECKRAVGLDVLAQAHRWLGHASMVSVATAGRTSEFADVVCGRLGVGWITVGVEGVRERVAPALVRRIDPRLRARLRPEHQTLARAGTNGGGYWSEWRSTCARLRELVDRDGGYYGVPVRAAVAQIAHHYATDRSAANALTRDAALGSIPGVALIEWPGTRGRFFVAATPAPGVAETGQSGALPGGGIRV